jgi:predicted transcriptional regulator
MTRNVATCGANDPIGSILKRMTNGKFRHMPVLENDRVIGLVSIGDIGKRHMEVLLDHVRQHAEYLDEIGLMKH